MTNITNVLTPQATDNTSMITMLTNSNTAQDTQLMTLMDETAGIENDIASSTYSILELEYFLGQIPDLSDLE